MRRESVIQKPLNLVDGQPLLIAFHLYKKCFSIRCFHTRKVIGYADRIVVSNARFLVSQSGRARVLREKMKNIHAFVQGEYQADLQHAYLAYEYIMEAYYNPYKVSTFVDKRTMTPIHDAQIAIFDEGKVYYIIAHG